MDSGAKAFIYILLLTKVDLVEDGICYSESTMLNERMSRSVPH